eukprot:6107384-Alexandrium_andersonii.AAC.1
MHSVGELRNAPSLHVEACCAWFASAPGQLARQACHVRSCCLFLPGGAAICSMRTQELARATLGKH